MPLSKNKTSFRVLHVVGRMDRGGIETWLMNCLRRSTEQKMEMDFLATIGGEGTFDAEIRARNARIGKCDRAAGLLNFVPALFRFLRRYGPYDAVHSHVGRLSGVVLAVAAVAGVPVRISHAHSCPPLQGGGFARVGRSVYAAVTRRLLNTFATTGFAASESAAYWLYGEKWETDKRWRVLFCGIELSDFDVPVDQAMIRESLGVPRKSKVIGHVGRFVAAKNHELLLRIAAELIATDDRVYLLLVGDGPMREAVEGLAENLGIADHVIFAGVRSDVPSLLVGGMDVFVFPSLYEGLGLAVVEAQAAGLPCVLSHTVPHEAVVREDSVVRLPANACVSDWSRAVSQLLYEPRPDARLSRLAVEDSQFNLSKCVDALALVYQGRNETALRR